MPSYLEKTDLGDSGVLLFLVSRIDCERRHLGGDQCILCSISLILCRPVPHHNIATDFRRTLSAHPEIVPNHNLTQAFQPLSAIREIVPHRNLARIRPHLGALGECALPVGRDKRGR